MKYSNHKTKRSKKNWLTLPRAKKQASNNKHPLTEQEQEETRRACKHYLENNIPVTDSENEQKEAPTSKIVIGWHLPQIYKPTGGDTRYRERGLWAWMLHHTSL